MQTNRVIKPRIRRLPEGDKYTGRILAAVFFISPIIALIIKTTDWQQPTIKLLLSFGTVFFILVWAFLGLYAATGITPKSVWKAGEKISP